MEKWVCLTFLLQSVSAIKLRTGLTLTTTPDFSNVTCSNVSRSFRNDTQIEFFTLNRQPNDPNWPVLTAEVPNTFQEFMCAVTSRTLPANCSTGCGYLLKWQDPGIRTFNFTSVLYPTDSVLMNKFKQVISVETRLAGEENPLTSTDEMMYVLVVPRGTLTSVGLQPTDPARIPLIPVTAYQGGGVMAPAGTPGFHN